VEHRACHPESGPAVGPPWLLCRVIRVTSAHYSAHTEGRYGCGYNVLKRCIRSVCGHGKRPHPLDVVRPLGLQSAHRPSMLQTSGNRQDSDCRRYLPFFCQSRVMSSGSSLKMIAQAGARCPSRCTKLHKASPSAHARPCPMRAARCRMPRGARASARRAAAARAPERAGSRATHGAAYASFCAVLGSENAYLAQT